ncbi:MAG: barstar family protein [Elusimicrobia bacterium]|nr:barstar family protein [Elusimicrobiota bacterium]
MSSAEAFLTAAAPPHLADLGGLDAAALKRRAAGLGFAVFELDGARMRTKAELMEHLAAALGFPGDFGGNWDAAVDYLGDLAGVHGGTKFLVVVKDPAAVERADPGLYADFREVCGLACENARQWSRGTVTLKFAFTTP